MSWFARFWYQDLPDKMQADMLKTIPSNRPFTLGRFVGDSVKRWSTDWYTNQMNQATLRSWGRA